MFTRKDSKAQYERELDLPTLIDLVFLLLIFFITTLTLSSSGEPKPVPSDQQNNFELPKAMGRVIQNESPYLTNLLFQIEGREAADSSSRRVVYVLWPNEENKKTETELYTEIKDSLTAEPADSSFFATFPRNFLQMSPDQQDTCRAFRLIREKIALFHEENFRTSAPNNSNTIEIRATKETEFRIISFIMQQCSLYEDNIPRVTFRVMAPEGTDGGRANGI